MNSLRTSLAAPRLLAGFGAITCMAGAGLLASSRPAHTAGGPIPVTVANTPLSTTAADSPAKQGVQFQAILGIPDGRSTGDAETAYTVPAGKRLVIETVTALEDSSTDHDTVGYQVQGGLGNVSVQGGFAVVPNGSPFLTGEAHPHLYADAGSQVTASAFRTESGNGTAVFVTFTGYLIDISAPGGS